MFLIEACEFLLNSGGLEIASLWCRLYRLICEFEYICCIDPCAFDANSFLILTLMLIDIVHIDTHPNRIIYIIHHNLNCSCDVY